MLVYRIRVSVVLGKGVSEKGYHLGTVAETGETGGSVSHVEACKEEVISGGGVYMSIICMHAAALRPDEVGANVGALDRWVIDSWAVG